MAFAFTGSVSIFLQYDFHRSPACAEYALLSEKDTGATCNGRTAGPAERSAWPLYCTTSILTARRY